MASIHKKDRSPYWYASFRDAKGQLRSKSTEILRAPADPASKKANRKMAQIIADHFESQAKAGLPICLPGANVQASAATPPAILSFHDYSREQIKKVGSDPKYEAKLNLYFDNIEKFIGPKADRQIGHLHRSDFVGLGSFLLQMGYSETTVTAHLKALRQIFTSAVSQGYAVLPPITPKDYLANAMPTGPAELTTYGIEHLANSTSAIDWRSAILSGYYLGMDLVDAANQRWDSIDFTRHAVTWESFTRAGSPVPMTLPMHAVLEDHFIALKALAISKHVCPTLQGKSEDVLRARFRALVENADLPPGAILSGTTIQNAKVQFRSLKMAFAHAIGHTGLFRLARVLRNFSEPDLRARILNLPRLMLNPIPLLLN